MGNGTNKTPKALTKLAPEMTLKNLSDKTGFTVACLSNIFAGKWAGKAATIVKIAKALKKSPGEMFDYLAIVRARRLRAIKRGKSGGKAYVGN